MTLVTALSLVLATSGTTGLLGQIEGTPSETALQAPPAEQPPTAEGETPAAEDEAPAVEGETSAVEGEAPAAEDETPASASEAPAEETTPEVEKTSDETESAPVEEQTSQEAAVASSATDIPGEDAADEGAEDEAIEPFEPGTTPVKVGTGFMYHTADDAFSMGVRLRIQFRNETEFAEEGDENVINNTFGIRRARLQFKGHMFGKNNKYKAEFAFSPKDLGTNDGTGQSNTPLLSFYSEHTQLRDLSLRVGQYKLYYSRQRVISSGNQEFVDRSAAQGEFNLDRDVGFHFFSKDLGGLDLFKYYAGATLAEGRDVWESEDLTDGEDASYQLLGRAEFLPFGAFKDYSEGDFKRLDKLRLSIGAAYAYTKNGRQVRGYQKALWDDGGTVNYQNVNADLFLKYRGLSLFGELYWRDGKRRFGDITMDDDGMAIDRLEARNGLGYTAQVGYVLPTEVPINVGARYSAITNGGDEESTIGEDNEAGLTVGFFPGGHPLKVQADYFHLWDDQESSDRVRVQMQVAY